MKERCRGEVLIPIDYTCFEKNQVLQTDWFCLRYLVFLSQSHVMSFSDLYKSI